MFNRRTFLSTIATSALVGKALGSQIDKKEKAVIWLWLGGGISATEFINPIPNAPVEYRSVTGAITTNSDYLLGGNFEYMARIADKMSPVLSFAHKDASHGTATGWLMNAISYMGKGDGTPQTEPSLGSLISSLTYANSDRGIPSYVKINRIDYDSSAWLNANHSGYEASGEGVKNLKSNIELGRFADRMDIVKNIDKKSEYLYRSWAGTREQAYNIVSGDASKVFEVNREDPRVLDKYRVGKSRLGENLLLARRLIQNGSKFVTIHHGGWDMHADIHRGFNNLAPDVDYSVYTLVRELEQLDMLSNTMIVITSEFSRTPKLNAGLVGQSSVPGRDHWPGVVPLVLIGGELTRGYSIGTTNSLAEYPTSNPFTPKDLACTIFNHFDIDRDTKMTDNQNRPRYLVEEDARLIT